MGFVQCSDSQRSVYLEVPCQMAAGHKDQTGMTVFPWYEDRELSE